VELHPVGFLHITLQSLGFSGHHGVFRRGTLAQLIASLRSRLAEFPAFDISLGGLNAFQSAAFLEVRPTIGLAALRTVIRDTLGASIRRIDPYSTYLFHLTVGYFSAEASTSSVTEALEPFRGTRGGTMRVDTVDLVVLPTDQRRPFPPLQPVARFHLRNSAAVPY
jgi:2'-5' RNA ligase